MYKEFYNCGLIPLKLPQIPFLFLSSRQQEALAALYYGVQRRKRFVPLTGDVGTGKTLLIRCLLRMLKNNNIAWAHVFNSRLSSLEFLAYVATEFGLAASGKTKGQLLQDLSKYLFSRHQKKLTTVIVVDDAQGLSIEVLEEIRLLSNLETETEKLVQILLVGQHELDEKLDSFELRQLKQRIALRSHLEPFNLEETRSYIRHRLRCAAAPSEAHDLFADEAIERVFRHTRGVARLVNTVCENALIAAFARQLTRVPPDIVDEVAYDLRLLLLNAANPSRAEYGKSNSGTASCIKHRRQLTVDDESPHGRRPQNDPDRFIICRWVIPRTKCADRQPGKQAFAVPEDSCIFARLFNCPSVESVAHSSTVLVNTELDEPLSPGLAIQ